MSEKFERCPKCQTPTVEAPGIGLYCPNKACDVADNLAGVSHAPLAPFKPAPTKSEREAVARAETAEARLLEVSVALAQFGVHALDCAYDVSTYNDGPWPCTCGFEAALKIGSVSSPTVEHAG